MSRDNAYLRDILNAAQAIRRFVAGISKEQFLANEEKYEAVNRKFEIIGEASRNVPEAVRIQHPEVPWKEMAGMRDRLIHAYFGVDYHLVWTTIKSRLPTAKDAIRKISM